MSNHDFEQNLQLLRPALFGFTRRFTTSCEEGQDLVQDTLLKALMHRSKFKNDTNLKGWLFTIMRNTFINQYRKNYNSKRLERRQSEVAPIQAVEQYTFHKPDGLFQWKEMWQIVNSIKEELAKPFTLYTEGYKYQEIADQLDLPLGTVKNRIFQARQEIQMQLTD